LPGSVPLPEKPMKLSVFTFWFGLASIPLSILIWFVAPDFGNDSIAAIADPALRDAMRSAHSERWGIFVGLWPATLLILSKLLAERQK
jgi:hypothetical protein